MDEKGTKRPTGESGLGLVEIVIAMMLLAVLAVAFLPVLLQGVTLSSVNATRATAGQLVHEQIEIARGIGEDCSDIQALAATNVPNFTDTRSAVLTIKAVAGACPTTYPGTISYTVTVKRLSTGEALAAADALIYVANG